MKKLVLFDMDGTLSDDRQRKPLADAQDWDGYFSYDAQMADAVYGHGRALYEEMLFNGWEIGYLTARLERNRLATVDWLTRFGFINPGRAILRPELLSAYRPPRFKSLMVGALISLEEYDEIVLVDNDPEVVERVAADHGDRFTFFADWDQDPETASLAIVQN